MQQSDENGIVSDATGPPLGMGSCKLSMGFEGAESSSVILDDVDEAEQVSLHTPGDTDAPVPAISCGQQARGLAAQAIREVTSTTANAYLYTSYLAVPFINMYASS